MTELVSEKKWEVSRRIMEAYGLDGPPILREELVIFGYSVPFEDEAYWPWIERCHSEIRWTGKLIHPIFEKGKI
jgi:hypothetical protein